MKPRCDECTCWEPPESGTAGEFMHMGVCHRFPEAVTKNNDDWCREYHPNPEAMKKWHYGTQQYEDVNQ